MVILPPAHNRNRMWAGSRIEFYQPLKVEAEVNHERIERSLRPVCAGHSPGTHPQSDCHGRTASWKPQTRVKVCSSWMGKWSMHRLLVVHKPFWSVQISPTSARDSEDENYDGVMVNAERVEGIIDLTQCAGFRVSLDNF